LIKYNLSTYFLFPLLGLDYSLFKCSVKLPGSAFLGTRYVNTYLWDINAQSGNYSLLVVHRNVMDSGFQAFEDTLESMHNFVDSYDIVDSNYGVKVFSLHEAYHTEYDKFLVGKYSKFSQFAQDLCLTAAPIEMKFSQTLPDVFSRRHELRLHQEQKIGQPLLDDDEVWSVPDIVKETLNKSSKQTLQNGVIQYNRKIPMGNKTILE